MKPLFIFILVLLLGHSFSFAEEAAPQPPLQSEAAPVATQRASIKTGKEALQGYFKNVRKPHAKKKRSAKSKKSPK